MSRFLYSTFIVTMTCIVVGAVALFVGRADATPTFTFLTVVSGAYMGKRYADKKANNAKS